MVTIFARPDYGSFRSFYHRVGGCRDCGCRQLEPSARAESPSQSLDLARQNSKNLAELEPRYGIEP
jgi:hypothetical protein